MYINRVWLSETEETEIHDGDQFKIQSTVQGHLRLVNDFLYAHGPLRKGRGGGKKVLDFDIPSDA